MAGLNLGRNCSIHKQRAFSLIQKSVEDHCSGNGDAGLLVLDGFFVSLTIGKSVGLVGEEEVGGIASVTSNN